MIVHLALLLGLAVPGPALASTARHVVTIEGMTCNGCSEKVREALLGAKGVEAVMVSHLKGKACIEAGDDLDFAGVGAALKLATYEMTAHETVTECPDGLKGKLPDPWDGRGKGLDILVISRGEEVDLKAHLLEDKYTIIDFGASWCGPCHTAAETLVAYLEEHPDVAIRAVSLAGEEPTTSYEQPVVAQHLQYVKGVPWFIVHAPGGRVLHKGMEPGKLMTVIDKHRKKAARKKR